MDLCGDAWSTAATEALRVVGLELRRATCPVSGLLVGVVLAATHSADLIQVLARADHSHHRVVVIGPPDGSLDPWPVLAGGACDCVAWRDQAEAIASWAGRAQDVETVVESDLVRDRMVGDSRALRGALRDLVVAARYAEAPILVLGETGTGKELAARIAHAVSGRAGSLVVVDCTTIVPTLLGSELFGHERGAFTGAVSVRTGACSAADGGTLFLDEVGELPLELQAELLRVVQEGTYKRVGGDRWLHSDFRLVCATNRDLAVEVAEGRFRADLYHRIAAATVTLPPLRERREDLLPLFSRFFRDAAGVAEEPRLDPAVEEVLRHRDYPGNLRDLRQLAARIASRHVGQGLITPGDLPPQDRPVADRARSVDHAGTDGPLRAAVAWAMDCGLGLREVRDRVGDLAVDMAVQRAGGNVRAAAALLGVTDRAVHLRQARRTADTVGTGQDSAANSSANADQ